MLQYKGFSLLAPHYLTELEFSSSTVQYTIFIFIFVLFLFHSDGDMYDSESEIKDCDGIVDCPDGGDEDKAKCSCPVDLLPCECMKMEYYGKKKPVRI